MNVRDLMKILVNFDMDLEVVVVTVEVEDKYFRLELVEEDAWNHKMIIQLKPATDGYDA